MSDEDANATYPSKAKDSPTGVSVHEVGKGTFTGRLSRAFSSKPGADPSPPFTGYRRKSSSEPPLRDSNGGSPRTRRDLSPMRTMSEANEALGQLRRRVVS